MSKETVVAEEKERNSFYDKMIEGETKRFAPKKVKNKQVEILTLDALQAKHVLRHYNTKNRNPSKVVVTKYATDMRNGDWAETGQTIQFSSEGQLMDGQHRLLACVETGMSQEFIVVYGIPPKSFSNIDNGKIRTTGDIVGMEGV